MRKLIFHLSQLARKIGVDLNEQQNPIVIEMMRKIHEFGSIEFKIDFYPDGSWTAESINIDGIITGGNDVKEINNLIKDAIFTYFKIPPHLVNDSLLRANNEPVTVEQRVWAAQ